jgi:4-amino-4-deoxy-L-arabinose transferase-like glycosyltransferase
VTRPFERLPPASSGNRHARTGLLLVLVAAAVLRLRGLKHGIPFQVDPDEHEIFERAVRMMKTGDLNPHFFEVPSLYIYVQLITAIARFVTGAAAGAWGSLGQVTTFEFYPWGRAVAAIAGTATVWAIYNAGLRWSSRTALLAAALLAVMPIHVRESHFAVTGIPMTFFVTLTFLLSVRAGERTTTPAFALAGAAAGLATASQYSGVLALVLPLVACVMTPSTAPARLHAALATVAGCVAAFFIAAPYTLLDLPMFLNQFAGHAAMYGEHGAGGQIAVVSLQHLRDGFHWPASLLAVIGLGLGIVAIGTGRERLKWTIVISFPLLYFWFGSRQPMVVGRQLLSVVPFLALLAAAAVTGIVDRMPRSLVPRVWRRAIAAVLVLLAIVPASMDSLRFDRNASRIWTTEMAYRWLLANVPKESPIVIESRELVMPAPYKSSNVAQLRLQSIAEYAANRVDYLVASSQVHGPFTLEPRAYPSEYGDYARIFRETQEVARFPPSREHPGPEIRVLKLVR